MAMNLEDNIESCFENGLNDQTFKRNGFAADLFSLKNPPKLLRDDDGFKTNQPKN